MKFIKDVDTGEIFPVSDDVEEQINDEMPALYKDEITPTMKVNYSGIDGVNDLILQMSHELEEEKDRKTVYHKFPFVKIVSALAVCAVLVVGCVFGIRYVSSIDFKTDTITVEAPAADFYESSVDEPSERPINDDSDSSEEESQDNIDISFLNALLWSGTILSVLLGIGFIKRITLGY